MSNIILACNFETHDHSVAILKDGEILFAAAEERYSRKKSDGGPPPLMAIREGLKSLNLKPSDIDYLIFPEYPDPKLKYYALDVFSKIKLTSWKWPFKIKNIKRIIFELLLSTGIPRYIIYYLKPKYEIQKVLKGFKGETKVYNHHLSHAYSAYYTSGMKTCLSIIIEGSGGDYTTSCYKVNEGVFEPVFNIEWPHSLGQFYRLVTRILGFNVGRHAGKITGLAAFGDAQKCYSLVKPLVTYKNFNFELDELVYSLQAEYLSSKTLPTYFKGHTPEDISAAFQRVLEETVVQMVEEAISLTKVNKVALSGGVVANVKMNQKIMEIEALKELYIHPAMGDNGIALGAAFMCQSELSTKQGQSFEPQKLSSVYFGSGYADEYIEKEIKKFGFTYTFHEEVEAEIAKILANEKVVARFNGKMEYGPRALGNRSILYSPKDRSVNDWLNKRLKRTEFMPFAPSTLYDYAEECYLNVNKSKHSAEFMTITYDCTDIMKEKCPACVHVDGTARPNLVRKDANESYYKIIDEFRKLTGIPTVVNTSFNMHEEPIVCSPYDALRAFKLGNLDYLAIGPFIIQGEGNL